ncbi:hypothetical protein FOZ63_027660, partial [Perkinsus olseni]
MSPRERIGDGKVVARIVNAGDDVAMTHAVEELRARVYADSTKLSNKSRVKKLKKLWLEDVSSCKYKSIPQYVDAVDVEIEIRGCEITERDRRMIKRLKRAATRGQGPSKGVAPITLEMLMSLHKEVKGKQARLRGCGNAGVPCAQCRIIIEYRRRQEARPDDTLFVDQEGRYPGERLVLNEGYGLQCRPYTVGGDVYIEDSPEYSRRVWNTGLNKDDTAGEARASVERSEEESGQSE